MIPIRPTAQFALEHYRVHRPRKGCARLYTKRAAYTFCSYLNWLLGAAARFQSN
jgi:hypothetical protein